LAKAITASSSSGSWLTSLLATANALPNSSACGMSRSIAVAGGRARGGGGRCRRYWRRRRRGRRAGRRRRSRGEILDAAAELRPDRRRLQLRDVERRRLRRRVVELGRARSRVRVAVADHLLLDLVDLGLDAGVLARGRLGGARLESSIRDEPPSAASCSPESPSRRTLRSMSNSRLRTKSLRPLALDHRLELALGVIVLARFVVLGVEVGPLRRRIGHELDDLAKETRRVFGFRHREQVLADRPRPARDRTRHGIGERRTSRRTSSVSTRAAAAPRATV
jgi:hypothetical protein